MPLFWRVQNCLNMPAIALTCFGISLLGRLNSKIPASDPKQTILLKWKKEYHEIQACEYGFLERLIVEKLMFRKYYKLKCSLMCWVCFKLWICIFSVSMGFYIKNNIYIYIYIYIWTESWTYVLILCEERHTERLHFNSKNI